MTISALGSTSRSTLCAFTMLIGSPASPPAMLNSFGDVADELPAHQRVPLGVLVHRTVYGHQKPALFQLLHALQKVGIAALRWRRYGCPGR